MGKIIVIFSFLSLFLYAKELNIQNQILQDACLSCHQEQQIPSSLIYKRYLKIYSTSDRMQKAIFAYIKNPDQKHSIMPPQFFLKFPMKEASTLDDDTLQKMIKSYLHTFDIKKKLVLPQ